MGTPIKRSNNALKSNHRRAHRSRLDMLRAALEACNKVQTQCKNRSKPRKALKSLDLAIWGRQARNLRCSVEHCRVHKEKTRSIATNCDRKRWLPHRRRRRRYHPSSWSDKGTRSPAYWRNTPREKDRPFPQQEQIKKSRLFLPKGKIYPQRRSPGADRFPQPSHPPLISLSSSPFLYYYSSSLSAAVG